MPNNAPDPIPPFPPLLQRQRTLEAIHDNAIDAIITINESGQIETVNPATQRMFGYAPDELIGNNIKMLMPQPYRTEHDGYLANYRNTGTKKIIGIGREVTGQTKTGKMFPVHLAVSEIQLDGHRVFVGVIRDLTDTKLAEAQLQSKVLMNERLAAIGQMVSGLAHESRNAFQRSHACLAELELDLEGMPSSLVLVHKVQTALDDVNRLLEEVRCYSAPIILERRPCCLEQLVREVWQNLLDARPKLTPNIVIDKQPGFPETCLIDGDRIKLVIRNLLENAVFVTPVPGEVIVRLRFENHPHDDERTIRLEVIDQGPGVAEHDFEKIFAPFFTTKTKGTGLGLALSRRYVDAHGGRIFATVPESAGARFVVEFPFCQYRPNRVVGTSVA